MDKPEQEFEGFASIMSTRAPIKKAPAYQWQDLALRVIQELGIPNFKRSAVFKVCRDKDRMYIEKCLNETKELAKGKDMWKYFFKVVDNLGKERVEK
jgi:hypothetical protein